ncbi:MAG: ankyrin repeat domain-containing protein [Acidimicrobiia bacterium]|nr:ankyrin repeat domain-containing protein [Acidimicrobiia bacterium]NNL28173.1 ankyrin repeat domain-containing protein [Acidimicrobiia bacterium]
MKDPIAIHRAYQDGDLDALLVLLDDPPDFPNQRPTGPLSIAEIPLEYAIYHSPMAFIQTLIDFGADPNYGDHAGFPSLIAALSTDRKDVGEILVLLLDAGADIQQVGVNGFTPLHYAAAYQTPDLVQLLLDRGADPDARTNVDDYTTPLEEAIAQNRREAVAILEPVTGQDPV